MNFTNEKVNDVIITKIHLKRATYRETEEFKKILFEEINNNELNIVIDLDECLFMDSTFLGALITGLKKVKEKGGNLKLSAPREDARALLEITGAIRVFELYKTKGEAVNSYIYPNTINN